MKELKFRAWDRGNERWLYFPAIGLRDMLIMEKSGYWVVMQFTGLHDKNNKEIYESDYVICDGFDGTYEIEWQGCGFVGRHLESEMTSSVDLEMQTIEVVGNKYVGNIYEHGHLLKDE